MLNPEIALFRPRPEDSSGDVVNVSSGKPHLRRQGVSVIADLRPDANFDIFCDTRYLQISSGDFLIFRPLCRHIYCAKYSSRIFLYHY